MTDTPVTYCWDGEHMVPLARFVPYCNRQFVVGEHYQLIVHEDRSHASHAHYFAVINEVWKNLPDDIALRFQNPKRLRQWALCRTSEYWTDRAIALASPEDADRVGMFMKPTATDEYCEISINGCVVVKRTPLSQSYKQMGKQSFQDSKDQVLSILSELINTPLDQLRANAGKAA